MLECVPSWERVLRTSNTDVSLLGGLDDRRMSCRLPLATLVRIGYWTFSCVTLIAMDPFRADWRCSSEIRFNPPGAGRPTIHGDQPTSCLSVRVGCSYLRLTWDQLHLAFKQVPHPNAKFNQEPNKLNKTIKVAVLNAMQEEMMSRQNRKRNMMSAGWYHKRIAVILLSLRSWLKQNLEYIRKLFTHVDSVSESKIAFNLSWLVSPMLQWLLICWIMLNFSVSHPKHTPRRRSTSIRTWPMTSSKRHMSNELNGVYRSPGHLQSRSWEAEPAVT